VASHTSSVPAQAENAARSAANSTALDALARLGFVARALIYTLVGVLAVQIAFGDRKQANQQGALQTIAQQPLGSVVLWLIVAGLAGYALWRFSQAILGWHEVDEDAKRFAKRAASFGNGLIYAAIGVLALKTVTSGSSSGASQQQSTVAKVLDWPGGEAIVIAAGVVIAAVGIGLVIYGLRTDFEDNLDKSSMGPVSFNAARVLGLVGNTARGLVVALVGALFVKAAVDHKPGDADGLDAALKNIAGAPYGKPLLLIAAAGLIVFGLYCLIEARYRRLGTR
jgi:hypothetical protein